MHFLSTLNAEIPWLHKEVRVEAQFFASSESFQFYNSVQPNVKVPSQNYVILTYHGHTIMSRRKWKWQKRTFCISYWVHKILNERNWRLGLCSIHNLKHQLNSKHNIWHVLLVKVPWVFFEDVSIEHYTLANLSTKFLLLLNLKWTCSGIKCPSRLPTNRSQISRKDCQIFRFSAGVFLKASSICGNEGDT